MYNVLKKNCCLTNKSAFFKNHFRLYSVNVKINLQASLAIIQMIETNRPARLHFYKH